MANHNSPHPRIKILECVGMLITQEVQEQCGLPTDILLSVHFIFYWPKILGTRYVKSDLGGTDSEYYYRTEIRSRCQESFVYST